MAQHRPIDEAECRTIEVDLSRVFVEYDPEDTVIYRIRLRGNDLETAEIGGANLTIDEAKLTIEQPASDATFTNDTGMNVTIVAWSDADPSTRVQDTFLLRTYAARVRPLLRRSSAPSFSLRAGETRIIDLSDYFQASGINRPNDPCIAPNDRLFYKVLSGDTVGEIVNSDTGDVVADPNGTYLRVTGAATPGNTNVGIEATNTFNQKNTPDRAFVVRVESFNPEPVLSTPISDIQSNRNQEHIIDLDSHFTDENDTLTYTARRLSGSIATFAVQGSTLTIQSGDDIGVAGIRVVATDSNNQSVGDNFEIRVSNRPPVLQNAISNQTIYVGQPTVEIDLRETFNDADGDMMAFAVARSPSDDGDTANVMLNADGHTLEIRPGLDSGTGTFIVTAEDTKGGAASDGFVVTVATSDPPVLKERLGDQVMIVGTTNTIDLASHFEDQDDITYTVVRDLSDLGAVGGAAIPEGSSTLQLTAGVSEGTGTFLIRATDQSGQYVEDRFAIVVREVDPVAPTVANNIMDFSLQLGMRRVIDLATVFQDIEGAIYKVERTGTTVTYELVGSKLTLIASQTTGVTTFVVTVTNRSGLESTDTFQVTAIPVIVTLRPPTIENRIEDRELETGATIRYNLHNVFKNNKPGTDMTFAVARDREQVTTVIHNGNLLQIEATGNGATVFDVTATNEDGSVTDRFILTGVHHPEALGTIQDIDILARTTRQLNLLPLFSDTEGDSLRYTVRRAPDDTGSVGEASVDGAILTVGGGTASGKGTFIVTATDQSGNSTELPPFTVTVNASPPMVSQAIGDQAKSITSDRDPTNIDLNDYFADPGDTLMFSFEIQGDAVALLDIGAGGVLSITPNGNLGTMTITVVATDSGGFTGEQSFTYTVVRGPIQTASIPDQRLLPRFGEKRLNLDDYFSHPVGTITYSVGVTFSGGARASIIQGNILRLTAARNPGRTSFRVTATASGESIIDDLDVLTITNSAPTLVGTGVPDQDYGTGLNRTLDLTPYITDAELDAGDELRFLLRNPPTTGNIVPTISGSVITFAIGEDQTSTPITVRAVDRAGLFVEDTFTVRANDAPRIVDGGIPDQTLSGGFSEEIDVAKYFTDVGSLVFTVTRTSGTVGTVSFSGSVLTIEAGSVDGSAEFTVRATDQHGLFVEDAFALTIESTQPRPNASVRTFYAQVGSAAVSYDISDWFIDPDPGQTLKYNLVRVSGVGTYVLVGTKLWIDPGSSEGMAVLDLTATDDAGLGSTVRINVHVVTHRDRRPNYDIDFTDRPETPVDIAWTRDEGYFVSYQDLRPNNPLGGILRYNTEGQFVSSVNFGESQPRGVYKAQYSSLVITVDLLRVSMRWWNFETGQTGFHTNPPRFGGRNEPPRPWGVDRIYYSRPRLVSFDHSLAGQTVSELFISDETLDKAFGYRSSYNFGAPYRPQALLREASIDFDSMRDAGNGDPKGLVVGSSRAYSVDRADDKIYSFDRVTKAHLPNRDVEDLELGGVSRPAGVSFGPDGTLLVVDISSKSAVAFAHTARAPTIVTPIGVQSTPPGGSNINIDLAGRFLDRDGGTLVYEVARKYDDTGSIASASVSSNRLQIIPGSTRGAATFILTATSSLGGRVSDEFLMVVGSAPTLSAPIPEQSFPAWSGNTNAVTIDLSQHFADADPGETLTYQIRLGDRLLTDTGFGGIANTDLDTVYRLQISGKNLTINSIGGGTIVAPIAALLPAHIRATDSAGLFVETPLNVTIT